MDAFTKLSNRVFADFHRQPRVPPPFQGTDVTGMPADLATAETNAFRRLSPRRNRWPELVALDARVAELETRKRDTTDALRALHERLASAPRADADRLASWEIADRKGSRPQPTTEALDREIADREAESAGLDTAIEHVLAEKATFVDKHRARLIQAADQETKDAHQQLQALINELGSARDALVEARQAALYAALYPGELALRGPRETLVAGGHAKRTKDALGVDWQVEHARLLRALSSDAEYWRDAATPEQRAAIGGDARPVDPQREAVWTATPEGSEAERAERQAALRRHEELWGGDAA